MKVATKIHPRKFRCPEGKLKPEGPKASIPFCYRVVDTGKKIKEPHSRIAGRVMVVEFGSRITGRRVIGYFGTTPAEPIVTDKKKARRYIEGQLDKAFDPYDTPEIMDRRTQDFIKVGQDPEGAPIGTSGQFIRVSKNAWKILMREAKKK